MAEDAKVQKLHGIADRTIQQAICQVLVPICEEQFSEHSYGFRPNRRAHMALEQSLQYANEGYVSLTEDYVSIT